MKKNVKKYFVTRSLRIFLKRKYFNGDYASNLLDIKKWFNDENAGEVIVMRIEDSRMKFSPMIPKSDDQDFIREIVREQARSHSRKLRKRHEVIVYYVDDNFITTKMIGCKRGFENRMLKP